MKKYIIILILLIIALSLFASEDVSFIALGDLHYDKLEYHDLDWLKNKWQNPDDYRQVTKEYAVYTQKNWQNLIDTLKYQKSQYNPHIASIVQLGDLMEGIAGSPEYANKMANGAIDAIKKADLNVPWILVKGNHDGWYGPGDPEAYKNIVVPFVNSELNINSENSFYTYSIGPVEFICCPDYQDRDFIVKFIEDSLVKSKAKYKFVSIHTPIIPVTGRCWDLFSYKTANEHNNAQREKLLNLLAQYKAVVLCAHLHKYSIVKRSTSYGPVVQVMLNSVIRNKDINEPYWHTDKYGTNLIDLESQFEPATKDKRKEEIAEEAKYVQKFYLADMPGYAIISAFGNEGKLMMNVYCGLNKKTIFTENLTELFK